MQMQASQRTRKLVIGASVAALALTAATLFTVPSTLRGIASSNFMPHAMCYLYNQQLIALHLGSDAAIWLAYLAISCTLVYLVWRTRREIPFSWMFLAFGTFIVACGFTHFMEMVVLYKPLYWLSGDVKLVTALASVVTAIALPGLVPQVHTMVAAAHVSEERRLQLERANAELQQISSRIMTAQDSERRRIARELHDGVGQYLAAIKMSCDVALQESERGNGSAGLRDALNLLERCTSEVRTMSHLLHPPLLEEMGLASAVPWYVEGFTERSGVETDLDLPKEIERLPDAVELALFRVLQESLTNILRHSGSKRARIGLHFENGHVRILVQDFGRGFGTSNGQPAKSGVGIASMRERVRELSGELRINSKDTGTTVEAILPLPKEGECQKES
jgi:signal transduction histidine kinase